MIEAEICPDYDAFYAFIEAVLGSEWAMKLADNYGERPGPPAGMVGNPQGIGGKSGKQIDIGNARSQYQSKDRPQRGNHKPYLSERIAKEFPGEAANIGKGKKYKTVHEAARKLGIVGDRDAPCGSLEALLRLNDIDPEKALDQTNFKTRMVEIDAIDRTMQRKPGAPKGNRFAIGDTTNVDNVYNSRPNGNSRNAGLRRLRKAAKSNERAATVYSQVLANELSVHKALITLDMKPETFTVPLAPKRAAAIDAGIILSGPVIVLPC